MTTSELLEYHTTLCDKAHKIMTVKNHDYSGASGKTPFLNFEASERLGICTTEQGILLRMLDKVQRLSTFVNSGKLLVKNEGVHDSCIDLINYPILLSAYIKQKK